MHKDTILRDHCGCATHFATPFGTSATSSPSTRSTITRAHATSIAIAELKELLALPQDKYTNAFLGYGPEDTNFGLELTKNYGVDSYNLGSGFGHFGLALQDVYGAVDSIKAAGAPYTSCLLLFRPCLPAGPLFGCAYKSVTTSQNSQSANACSAAITKLFLHSLLCCLVNTLSTVCDGCL